MLFEGGYKKMLTSDDKVGGSKNVKNMLMKYLYGPYSFSSSKIFHFLAFTNF